jgi:5-deoxy-5-amino-3-dehydroquinate dehydratase
MGRLGERQPEIYGRVTLAMVEAAVRRFLATCALELTAVQEDGERELIQAVNRNRDAAGAIVNPASLMMTGYGLRDALADFPAPWIEVHLSNIWARERFRHESVLSPIATGVIVGLGAAVYVLAARALVEIVQQPPSPTDATTAR